jgi:hypothetical protein
MYAPQANHHISKKQQTFSKHSQTPVREAWRPEKIRNSYRYSCVDITYTPSQKYCYVSFSCQGLSVYLWCACRCVCMYVCRGVCMYVCPAYVCMYVCILFLPRPVHIPMVCMYVCVYVCMSCVRTYVCMYVCMYVWRIYVRMYVCVHVWLVCTNIGI